MTAQLETAKTKHENQEIRLIFSDICDKTTGRAYLLPAQSLE